MCDDEECRLHTGLNAVMKVFLKHFVVRISKFYGNDVKDFIKLVVPVDRVDEIFVILDFWFIGYLNESTRLDNLKRAVDEGAQLENKRIKRIT